MNYRENTLAILNDQPYEKLPVVSFGYWGETVDKWAAQGHIAPDLAEGYKREGDNSPYDRAIMDALGFDFNWNATVGGNVLLDPPFPLEVLETHPDGSRVVRDELGLIVKDKPGTTTIPAEIGTSLTDRAAWEALYKPRLKMHPGRIDRAALRALPGRGARTIPLGLHLGSLMGNMRNMLGVEQLSYLYMDDEDLYREIADTLCGLCYEVAKEILSVTDDFDYAHFWEDICFKNGPLVVPAVFDEICGPWYRRITDLVAAHGISIVSLDCDGCIDLLLPTWVENGVNTMFPIEVGTWGASIAPWRAAYGKRLRGVGGVNKTVFARDRAAVDEEVERLRPLIDLGGYIPCPDHRIAPDAQFELVRYYCERMQSL